MVGLATRPVYQTRFGNEKADLVDRGNCVQASVATLLGLELDEVPDCSQVPDGQDFWTPLETWLLKRGLGTVWTELHDGYMEMSGQVPCILNVTRHNGNKHTVVGRVWSENDKIMVEVLHDPLGEKRRDAGVGFAKAESAMFLVPMRYEVTP